MSVDSVNTWRNSDGMHDPDAAASEVALLRRFNRLYTEHLGLLNGRLDGSPFSLTEARVLYELAHRPGVTAAEIARLLSLDPAQLSRLLARFKKQGLIVTTVSPDHSKRRQISLTERGSRTFSELQAATNAAVARRLGEFTPADRRRLLSAAGKFADTLERSKDKTMQPFHLRAPRPGDIGWVLHRQAVLYAEEYGWDWTYEALAAKILADFIERFDPAREKAWIAELEGEIVGSIFLKASEDAGVAKLRLLYVEPSARGRGIGRALVDACIDQARAFSYRRLELWTNSVLVSARRIYEAAGFELTEEAPHHSFGKDLVGQIWSLGLEAEETAHAAPADWNVPSRSLMK